MHTSQSSIPQSIYQSQTHQLKMPAPKRDSKPIANEHQQPFIHYYEENIKLKKKQDQMAKEILQMNKRLNEQAHINRQNRERQLKMLATGKKSLWDTKHPQGRRKISTPKPDSQKVQNLLQIIDHYKNKMMLAEEQIQNLKRQKHMLEQDGKVKDRKADQIMKSFQETSSHQGSSGEIEEQLRSAVNHLQIEKQRNKFNEAEIKRLEARIKNLTISQSQQQDLKAQNRNLEDKLMRMTQLPSFGAVIDKADQEHKVKEIERKYKGVSEKYNQLKSESVKLQAEVKFLKNKLIEVNYEADQLQKQNQRLKKESFGNPILSKLARDQSLLEKVVYEIQYAGTSQKRSSELDRQTNDKILLEKEMLAKELTSMRAQMDAMRENWKQKQRISKIQKEELVTMYKEQAIQSKADGKIMSKNGVPYSDDVSMFTQDATNIPANTNYFDLFLGDLHLLETMMKTVFSIHNADSCLVMATVDFYNHNTENTKPVHGAHANLQSEFSFKVTEDQFFFKYLNKGQFYVDAWGSQGSKRHNFGRALVDLKPLIIKSRKNISPVVSASAPIYLNQRVMGSVNLVMRMRLPIYEQLQRVNEIGQLIETEEDAPTRRLIIQIQEGRGFNEKANTFVYYPFRLQDYYTKTYRGSNPAWNHHKSIQLKYNTDLKNYLRKNELELVVLDDNAVITGEDASDLVGNAYVSLLPLLQNKIVKERVQVVKGAQKVGFIDLKIFWHDLEQIKEKKEQRVHNELFDLQVQISDFLRENRLQPEDIFRMIDRNKTGMISFSQFHLWVSKINPSAPLETVNEYYNSFRQPVNMINFTSRLTQKPEAKSEIAKELSMINQLMHQNTTMINKKQTLQQFLKGKDIVQISLDIDKNRNGRISKAELQEYFDEHGIEAEIDDEREIQIVKFLKKYQKYA